MWPPDSRRVCRHRPARRRSRPRAARGARARAAPHRPSTSTGSSYQRTGTSSTQDGSYGWSGRRRSPCAPRRAGRAPAGTGARSAGPARRRRGPRRRVPPGTNAATSVDRPSPTVRRQRAHERARASAGRSPRRRRRSRPARRRRRSTTAPGTPGSTRGVAVSAYRPTRLSQPCGRRSAVLAVGCASAAGRRSGRWRAWSSGAPLERCSGEARRRSARRPGIAADQLGGVRVLRVVEHVARSGPTSTSRPSCITPTRSATCRTTARSCEMNR